MLIMDKLWKLQANLSSSLLLWPLGSQSAPILGCLHCWMSPLLGFIHLWVFPIFAKNSSEGPVCPSKWKKSIFQCVNECLWHWLFLCDFGPKTFINVLPSPASQTPSTMPQNFLHAPKITIISHPIGILMFGRYQTCRPCPQFKWLYRTWQVTTVG